MPNTNNHGNTLSHYVLIAVGVVILDQLMKIVIRAFLVEGIYPLGFLELNPVKNYGAAFGILRGQQWLFILISLVVIITILYAYLFKGKTLQEEHWIFHLSVMLLLGGTVGNFIDRLFYGYVFDFIDLKIWPAFNVADIAITVATVGLLMYFLKK